ncbi:CopG antitoxin of type II toxin-antitoxin system [Prosthecobacter fusiformis]|uniref:CopG antitoxin of type II toxin-antitoxin system n=1 Tax=Prosthecobacter fusiformis TaxID=48464 RepID=A0A4R7RLC0_9BACT|nr:CopG family antitoxin [Prosthecobacter fusiformis]TDU66104.1 CopG antitoxin of type II toxin-antitoxin system [Prosthecobacter fusiformis]
MEPSRRKNETTQIPRFSDELPAILAWKEVPSFDSPEAEGKFWEKHQVDPRLMQMSIHRSDVRESTTITLRFDPRMLSRIKRIARRRYLNYQSMIKQWLSERMEQEMRD